MATWPAYATVLMDGFAEQRESALMRTEMESGPPRQTKIKSRVLVTRQVAILVNSQADYASFLTWFKTDLGEGADWFTWTDPVTGASISARFVGGGLTASPLAGASGAWRISASIETWSA